MNPKRNLETFQLEIQDAFRMFRNSIRRASEEINRLQEVQGFVYQGWRMRLEVPRKDTFYGGSTSDWWSFKRASFWTLDFFVCIHLPGPVASRNLLIKFVWISCNGHDSSKPTSTGWRREYHSEVAAASASPGDLNWKESSWRHGRSTSANDGGHQQAVRGLECRSISSV